MTGKPMVSEAMRAVIDPNTRTSFVDLGRDDATNIGRQRGWSEVVRAVN
jgi:hypothetical protein